MYHNGIQSYRKTNVITADPGKLVIMCYEGAIDNLIIAKQKYQQNKYEDKCNAIKKAQDIIDELLCSLDFEKGGSIAVNLESLYNYMRKRIICADVNQDMTALDEVIGMLHELLAAWKEVFTKPGKKIQPQAVSFDESPKSQAVGYMSI
jgi:flagellar protein FliS